MAFAYFHKSTQEFQFVLLEQQDFEWNDCFEVEGAQQTDIYKLENGNPVFVRSLSSEEIEFAQASILEFELSEYKRRRACEYPSITDYLDGIVKGDEAQVQAYIDACLAVKAKYPKPE